MKIAQQQIWIMFSFLLALKIQTPNAVIFTSSNFALLPVNRCLPWDGYKSLASLAL